MPAPVSVWTSGRGASRRGWTISSLMVADGAPAEVVGLLDEDSDLADLLLPRSPVPGAQDPTFVVNLLSWPQRSLADVFAGLAPAPGGAFTLGSWTDTDWGPALHGGGGWIGARMTTTPGHAGWGLLVRGVVEHVEVPDLGADGVLTSFRGRYRPMLEL